MARTRAHTHAHMHAHTQAIMALRGAFNPDSFLGLLMPSEREQFSACTIIITHILSVLWCRYIAYVTHTHTHTHTRVHCMSAT